MEYLINNYGLLTIIFSVIVVSNFLIYRLVTQQKPGVYSGTVTDTKLRVTPKHGCREYKLACKIECYQEELTWDQDVKVMNIISGLGIDEIFKKFRDTGEIQLESVISIFRDHSVLERFLDIIMHVTYRPPDQKWKLYNSELRVIFTDFFILNPESKMILEIMRLAAGITVMKDTRINSEIKADQT